MCIRDSVRPAPFQLFRNLAPPIEAALRASIYRFGVLVPIAKDQHGNILDGHQRARIADELGVKYPVNIIEVADDADALLRFSGRIPILGVCLGQPCMGIVLGGKVSRAPRPVSRREAQRKQHVVARCKVCGNLSATFDGPAGLSCAITNSYGR